MAVVVLQAPVLFLDMGGRGIQGFANQRARSGMGAFYAWCVLSQLYCRFWTTTSIQMCQVVHVDNGWCFRILTD